MDARLVDIVRDAGAYLSSLQGSTVVGEDAQPQQNESMKAKLLANWDLTYPEEQVNFYQEFIQRHAPHTLSWFQDARHGHEDDNLHHEATGAGILFDGSGMADKVIAPLEDGSISVWEASATQEGQGKIIARSAIGVLADRGPDLDFDTRVRQSQAIMTETGAVECVSIDSRQKKGFFAVQNVLNEVDLATLQIISRTPYPFPITAVSEAHHPTPLTVGTNWTIHIHDTRKPPSLPLVSRAELIGGDPSNSFSRLDTGDFGGHVSLAQPGALSILHLPPTQKWDANGDIWVAGRFTSFLNFDRRYFPRLRGTVHSGARLSCLTAIPYPFIVGDLRVGLPYSSPSLLYEVKSIPGHTMIAAGEYKGKGSLELYSLSSEPSRSIDSSDSRTTRNSLACYQNRQTASSSKLLSVAPHGSRLVFSDGDGSLKWVERDGSTLVRQFNINDETRALSTAAYMAPDQDDIVQKILPTVSRSLSAWARAPDDVPLGQDNLITWTGDGRLGMVSYGGAGFDADELDEQAKEAEMKELRNKEREYGAEMRRALEQQARELRWMQGYGL
jgi:hypothetical protein